MKVLIPVKLIDDDGTNPRYTWATFATHCAPDAQFVSNADCLLVLHRGTERPTTEVIGNALAWVRSDPLMVESEGARKVREARAPVKPRTHHYCDRCCAPWYDDGEPAFDSHDLPATPAPGDTPESSRQGAGSEAITSSGETHSAESVNPLTRRQESAR